MIVNVAAAGAGLLVEPAARRDVDFAADDRLDAFVAGGFVEIDRAVEHAVVGDGERGEFQLVGLLQQPIQPARAIEQGILGVEMEMNKDRVRHAGNLTPDNQPVQGKSQKVIRRI